MTTMKPSVDFENRISVYNDVSEQLEKMTDRDIEEMMSKSTPIGRGIGGLVSSVLVGASQVFVKKIRLTDIELSQNNYRSTRNYFDLPLCYLYGIGSAGFGCWRELLTHETTTKWVLEKMNPSFPLLFHSRILPRLE